MEDLDWLVCLLNAIYFKGTWTYEFDKNPTQEKDFTLFDQSIKKHPLMEQERKDFFYVENNDFQAVNLPYGENKRLSMYVFLPKNNLENFLTKLSIDNWSKWIKESKKMEGTLLLPKFKIEYDKELKEVLIDLGMRIAFSGGADFSKMTENVSLFIDRVIHKTFVEVDEKGTEAAAVTAVLMKKMAAPDAQIPPTFYMEVNKPFFFTICDNETGEILFMGVIKEPKI